MRKDTLASMLLATLGIIVLPGAAAPPRATPPPSGIQILSDVPLPAGLNTAIDIRWAGEDSVYLALKMHGAAEYNLSKGTIREVFPGASKLGGLRACNLVAASSQFILAAPGGLSLAWKRPTDADYRQGVFEIPKAIDVWKDRLLILGLQRNEKGEVGADGAIGWLGSLEKGLEGLKPVLYDVTGPGARSQDSCAVMAISAARFLADGRFVLAPGVQAGISLHDATGKLVRTWDTGSLGIDTDCASLSPEQVLHISASYPDNLAWVNRRRTIDVLLPLRDGAALIVRSLHQGRPRWEVKRLREDGSVQSLPLPLEAEGEHSYLSGDARDGKILLLLHDRRPQTSSPPRLIRLQLPE